MSATVETNTTSWRKRLREDDSTTQMGLKRPRYYYRLESESSKASEEDTESVCSLQGKETDIVRDTTDTDSKSEWTEEEYEVQYEEYDVASLSGSENGNAISDSSTDCERMLVAAAVAICDSSIETWITDCEDSDNTSLDESSFGKTDFSVCIQCKSENDNPLYRYCEKCFQQTCRQCKMRKTFKCFPLCIYCYKDRKKFYPPRPKKNKKSRNMKNKDPPVKLDLLQSCLKDLSQDSGIGSSQEWPVLDLDQIVVPEKHLASGTSKISTITESNEKLENGVEKKTVRAVTSTNVEQTVVSSNENQTDILEGKISNSSSSLSSTDKFKRGRKRRLSESSLSDFDLKPKEIKVSKISPSETLVSLNQTSDHNSEVSTSCYASSGVEKLSQTDSDGLKTIFENAELCILCNDAPKDAIFLHSKVAHQCCCYKCAKRTVKSTKRCPICNISVNKVFRVIKS